MLVDQFLYKARVITEDEIEEVNSWIIDDVEEAGYHLIEVDEYFNKDNPMYKELLPYCIQCEVNDIHIDYDMIKAVYRIPNCMELYQFNNDGKYITLIFKVDSKNYFKEIKLTEGEYISYINKETYPYYVTYLEEIYAWQNNIGLYHEIRQYKDIDDCIFYQLDQFILKNISQYTDKEYIFEEDLICDENESLFYFEEG
ncbi:MAG: hypothetical protein LUH02_12840 [Erysipelotrichaceae bacterium]|nr:hypothetical protein [Erysipelotrichaceae bacterium]